MSHPRVPDRLAPTATAPLRVHQLPAPPGRFATAHKGMSGKIAIVAGCVGMTGAAVLAARGALRCGAGLVRVYCPLEALPLIAAAEPSCMTAPLLPDPTIPLPAWHHAVAAGPGMGQTPQVRLRVGVLLREPHPLVLDADALNGFAALQGEHEGNLWCLRDAAPTLLTPHPGELVRLCHAAGLTLPADAAQHDAPDEARIAWAHRYAQHSACVVLLKGARTVVADAERVYVNDTGNPGMAVGGMGDVLTGVVTTFVAQGMPMFDAASLAACIHGEAGDECGRAIGPVGFLPSELAAALPQVLARRCAHPLGFRT